MFNKIVKVCLYGLVFLMPLFFLTTSLEAFEFNKGYLLFFLTTVGLLAWLGQMIFQEKSIKFKWTSLDPFVLVFLAITILSAVFAKDKVSSLLGFYGRFWPSLLGTLSLGGFYFLVTNNVRWGNNKGDSKKDKGEEKLINNNSSLATTGGILKAFFISCFVVVVVSFLSLFGVFAKLAKLIPQLPRIMTLQTFNLIGGSLEALSIFLTCAVVFLVGLISLRGNKSLIKGKGVYHYILLLLSVVLLVIIDFTVSWWVMLISLILFLVFSFWKRVFKEDVNRLSLSVVLILVALVMVTFNPLRTILPKDSSINNLPAEVLLTQRASWRLSWNAVKDSPVLGAGDGNFGYVFAKFKPQSFVDSAFWQLRFDRAGSYIAELVATGGILGALSYLLMLGMFLLVSYFVIASVKLKGAISYLTKPSEGVAQDSERKIIMIPFLIAMIGFVVGQFLYYQNAALAFGFWMVLALGVVSWNNHGDGQERERGIKVFSFKKFPEIGLVFSIVFWVALIAILFVYFSLGKYYLADNYYKSYLSNPAEKLPQLEKAVRLAPKRTTYHIMLARGYLDKFNRELAKPAPEARIVADMVALAVQESKISVDQSPNRIASYEMAGVIYREVQGSAQGATEWAIKSFESALALEPKNPVVLTELGKLYLIQEDTIKAREMFERAVTVKKSYIEANLQLALLEDTEGRTEEAQGRLESLVRLAPFSVEARFQLGRLYYNRDELNKAAEQFREAIALFPNHSNSLYSLGLIYERQGERAQALEVFEKVLNLNPGNTDVESKVKNLESTPTPQPEENEETEENEE